MKEGSKLGFVAAGYLVIGTIIGLTQLGLNKLFEPPCDGVVKHVLWERGHAEGTHFLWRVGSSVAQWWPDLYSRVLKGDMTARDYLLGGYRCEPVVALKPLNPSLAYNPSGLSRTTMPEGLRRLSEMPPLSGKSLETAGPLGSIFGGARAPGSQAEALVKGVSPPAAPNPAPAPALDPLARLKTSDVPAHAKLADDMLRGLLETKRTPSPMPTEQPAQNDPFVTIDALPGVSLAVPRDWLVVGSEEIQQHVTAGEAVYGSNRGIPKTENTKAFRPPTDSEGVGIAVASTPLALTQEELRSASDAEIREWATVIERQARRGVEAQGLKLLPLADITREAVGGWLGLAFKARIVDAEGAVYEQSQLHVPTAARTITLNLSYGKGAPPVFRPILAHARATLRIAEPGQP